MGYPTKWHIQIVVQELFFDNQMNSDVPIPTICCTKLIFLRVEVHIPLQVGSWKDVDLPTSMRFGSVCYFRLWLCQLCFGRWKNTKPSRSWWDFLMLKGRCFCWFLVNNGKRCELHVFFWEGFGKSFCFVCVCVDVLLMEACGLLWIWWV